MVVEKKETDGKEEKILPEEDRPRMEDVFLKVWALLEAYQYIIEADSGIQSGVKTGLGTLQRSLIKEFELAHYGEPFWEIINEREQAVD